MEEDGPPLYPDDVLGEFKYNVTLQVPEDELVMWEAMVEKLKFESDEAMLAAAFVCADLWANHFSAGRVMVLRKRGVEKAIDLRQASLRPVDPSAPASLIPLGMSNYTILHFIMTQACETDESRMFRKMVMAYVITALNIKSGWTLYTREGNMLTRVPVQRPLWKTQ